MSKKKTTPAPAAPARLKLSTPANQRDLLALLAEQSCVELLENADDLINHAIGVDHTAVYRKQLPPPSVPSSVARR